MIAVFPVSKAQSSKGKVYCSNTEMILTSKFSEELNDTLRNWLLYRIMKIQNKEPQQVDGIFRKYFETAVVIIDA